MPLEFLGGIYSLKFAQSARVQRANLLQFTPILSAERMHFVQIVPAKK